MTRTTTLVVTNDFPPRIGGIEGFVAAACHALGDVVVLTRTERDTAATRRYDARLPFEVVRIPGPLVPSPYVARTTRSLLVSRGATRVLYGAAAPLGLLAPSLRRAGAAIQLGLTHGHEVWWASLPGARSLLVRIASGLDHVGVISAYTEARIAAALPPALRGRLVRLPPPVDGTVFRPGIDDPGPVVLAAGRLVAQKGVSALLDAWPMVRSRIPAATLLIAGDGPQRRALRAQARQLRGVTLLGAVPYDRVPDLMRSARVFALPVRTRFGGLNPEGLGRVFLEAAASGLPVVVGDSGGAPETVVDGVTGSVVRHDDPAGLAAAIVGWLESPERSRTAGLLGRGRVVAQYGERQVADTIRRCLGVDDAGADVAGQ